MLENAIRDVWRRSRSNMYEYSKNSEGLSGNLISTYCITVTNHPISPGDLSVGSEVLHTPPSFSCGKAVGMVSLTGPIPTLFESCPSF